MLYAFYLFVAFAFGACIVLAKETGNPAIEKISVPLFILFSFCGAVVGTVVGLFFGSLIAAILDLSLKSGFIIVKAVSIAGCSAGTIFISLKLRDRWSTKKK